MTKCSVLSVLRYDFETDDGKQMSGTKVKYVLTGKKYDASDKNRKGYEVMNAPADIGLFHEFPHVPGTYDIEFGQKMSGTKASLYIESVQLLGKEEQAAA